MKNFILWYTTLCSQNSTDVSEKYVDTSSASKIKPSKKETSMRPIARRTCFILASSFHYSSVLMMVSHPSKLSVDYQRIFLQNVNSPSKDISPECPLAFNGYFSKMSVDFQRTTQPYIPEDTSLQVFKLLRARMF
jgi:hypothetical protein